MRGWGEGSIRRMQNRDGTVYWEARVTVDGRQRSFYGDTKTGAAAAARQARADAERGMAQPRGTLTVKTYLRSWL
jgi:hypothetical protein